MDTMIHLCSGRVKWEGIGRLSAAWRAWDCRLEIGDLARVRRGGLRLGRRVVQDAEGPVEAAGRFAVGHEESDRAVVEGDLDFPGPADEPGILVLWGNARARVAVDAAEVEDAVLVDRLVDSERDVGGVPGLQGEVIGRHAGVDQAAPVFDTHQIAGLPGADLQRGPLQEGRGLCQEGRGGLGPRAAAALLVLAPAAAGAGIVAAPTFSDARRAGLAGAEGASAAKSMSSSKVPSSSSYSLRPGSSSHSSGAFSAKCRR